MKIMILGTRGEIKPTSAHHAKKSGILIDNELLIDVGEKTYLDYKPKHIFITHLHPDHAFFVREPKKEVNHLTIPMYGPESYRDSITVKKCRSRININKHTLVPIPTHHSLKVASQAYLIKTLTEKILYTGDMIWIDKVYHRKLAHLNLVITEASFIRKGGRINRDKLTGKLYGHAGIPDLLRLFSPFTKYILFVHFGSWFYENMKKARKDLISLGRDYNMKVIIGHDGMVIDTNKLK